MNYEIQQILETQQNGQKKGVPLNLQLKIQRDNKKSSNYLQSLNSPQTGTPLEEQTYLLQKELKAGLKNNRTLSKGITPSIEDNSPLKSNDSRLDMRMKKHSNNFSIGSDSLTKQNSTNSCDKQQQERYTPGKKNLSKFNYQGIDSPQHPNIAKAMHNNVKGYPYLVGSTELYTDSPNMMDQKRRDNQFSIKPLLTQPDGKFLSSSKQSTKQYFFQKCVSELNSPLNSLPNVNSRNLTNGQLKLLQQSNKLGSDDLTKRKNKKTPQLMGVSQDRNNSQLKSSSSAHQMLPQSPQMSATEYNLPENKLHTSQKSMAHFPSLKNQSRQNNSLAQFNGLDDTMLEEINQTQNTNQTQYNKFCTTILKDRTSNKNGTQSMNNLSFGLQDRQSINHKYYQDLQKMERQKQKEEYFHQEVAKVKQVWHQYENQRSNSKQNNLQNKAEVVSPLNYQKTQILKEQQQKMIESKNQQFFNKIISTAKQTTQVMLGGYSQSMLNGSSQSMINSTIQPTLNGNSSSNLNGQSQQNQTQHNHSLLQSPRGEGHIGLSPFDSTTGNHQSTLNSIPAEFLQYTKEDAIISTTDISKICNTSPIHANSTFNNFPSRLQTYQAGAEAIDQNEEDLFWESTNIWENIIKDSFEIIKKEKIIESQEFNFQLLLDFLNNVVGRNYQNNQKYMRESLKMIGLTPEVSEILCERISRIMSEKYGIKNKQINKFINLFKTYEKAHLSWNLIDRMGGKGRIEEIISTYHSVVNTNPSVSAALRLLNITQDLIDLSFFSLLSQEERRHKQYFRAVQQFFKQPLYRISHTKFFLASKFCLERSLQKNKIQPQLRNRIYLLVEQMRFFVTLPLPQDTPFLLPPTNSQKKSENIASPNQKNGNKAKGSEEQSNNNNAQQIGQENDSLSEDSKVNVNNDEYGVIPGFCGKIGQLLRCEMMGMIKIKQALIKLSAIHLNNKLVFELYLTQLVQIFTLNNNDSVAFYEVLYHEKYRTILLLTDDFFALFSKLLMENLVKNLHASIYFCKDTHKRLQHVRILINRAMNNLSNKNIRQMNYNVSDNLEVNYINGACFFNELFNHPNAIELILDKLDDLYHNKSSLNKLCTFSKVQRSRALCRYILCYLYPFVDQNGYSEFVSAFDFQCYVNLKKLKAEFFIELRRVIKDLFINIFNFPVNLVSRLIQEYSYALHDIQFFSVLDNGSSNLYRKKAKTLQKTTYDDEFDDEKQEF